MQLGRKFLSAIYILFVILMLSSIVTAPSVVAMAALALCLFALYAINDIGGTISLRLGQFCGGLILLFGLIDLVTTLRDAFRSYSVSLVGLVITWLIIALGWFSLVHLSKRGGNPVEDAAS